MLGNSTNLYSMKCGHAQRLILFNTKKIGAVIVEYYPHHPKESDYKSLQQKDWVSLVEGSATKDIKDYYYLVDNQLVKLSTNQMDALCAKREGGSIKLLHGIPGSGKTLVAVLSSKDTHELECRDDRALDNEEAAQVKLDIL